jgi:hypothetical protein
VSDAGNDTRVLGLRSETNGDGDELRIAFPRNQCHGQTEGSKCVRVAWHLREPEDLESDGEALSIVREADSTLRLEGFARQTPLTREER